ncbi:MAG TPA: DUF1801 domain-containing protein [Blastocatellia bacterium]|nr:DUF1801 domain-containing protein [Blastocatellia bacterium]
MKTKFSARKTIADSPQAVDEFMRTLEHPPKKLIEAIRNSILGADRSITEGIKWNSPSFRTSEHFATMNLREKKGIGVILHRGAKKRDLPSGGIIIEDPSKVLKWLGKDRAMIVFDSLGDFSRRNDAFERIIQQWIRFV